MKHPDSRNLLKKGLEIDIMMVGRGPWTREHAKHSAYDWLKINGSSTSKRDVDNGELGTVAKSGGDVNTCVLVPGTRTMKLTFKRIGKKRKMRGQK